LPPQPTPREMLVIRLIAEGAGSKEIAVALGVEISTVVTHRSNLYRRMGFRHMVDVTHWALAHGIVSNRYESGAFFGS
jgi:DNA-binding NarL/FixJ family response regulator